MTPRTAIRWPDALLPVGFAACAAVEFTAAGYGWLGAYLLAAGVLVLRRRYPVLMPVAVAGLAAASGLLGGREAFLDAASWLLPPALACFAAGQYARRAWLGLTSVVVAMVTMYLTLVHLAGFSADVLFGLIVCLGPWACGLALGVALRRAADQAATAERERVLREFAAEAGAVTERLRIAQDLHDSLAHSLTVMVVQADLADDLLADDPTAARQALSRVRARGREVLVEANRVVRANREGAPPAASHPSATVDSLIRDAGSLGVRVDVDEPLAEVPAGIAPVVFAVVQEGLTNAARYSPGRHVRFACRLVADDLTLTFVNVGGGEPLGGGLGGGDSVVGVRTSGGLGLVGLGERVAACGGEMRVELEPEFALSVRIPGSVRFR